MKYEKKVIIYIDLLGFKDFIYYTIKTSINHGQKIQSAYGFFEFLKDLLKIEKSPTPNKQVTHFSDLIVISFPADEFESFYGELFDLLIICSNCITHGFLVRGTVIYGEIVHTSDIIFGPGLVEAYETEKSRVITPRITIEKTIVQDLLESKKSVLDIFDIVSVDEDGEYYLDYFVKAKNQLDNPAQFLLLTRKLVEIARRISTNPSLKQKCHWINKRIIEMFNSIFEKFKIEDENHIIDYDFVEFMLDDLDESRIYTKL